VSVKVTKELFGLTKQNVLHSFKGDLIFQLEAVIENGKVNNVTIAAINDNTRYKNLAADDRLRGFHLSLVGEPAQSQLSSSTLMENTYWQQQPQVGFNFGVNFTWFFNRLFGVTVGAHKTEYVTNFLLNSFSGQSTIEMIDEDNDKYYQVYEISDLTEMNSLNYIEVPLMLNYRTGRAKTGIYLDLGLVYALSLNTSYQVEGLTNRMGYYPEYDLLLDDIPEYGFETVVLDDAGSWQVKSSSLSGIARLGLSFPISQKIYFKVGGVAVYGIDDILYNKPKHNEDFISTMGIIPTSTTLLRIGLEAGVSLKLY
jgi:hypothetical protein